MNTTIEALQALYVKLGGTLSNVENIVTIPDMIDAIAALDTGGSSSLPAVTIADNDKVLTVVDGEWDKAEASGGGVEQFIVTFSQSGSTWSANKTLAEITEAFNAGKEVFGAKSGMGGTMLLPLIEIQTGFQVSFARMNIADGSSIYLEVFTIGQMSGTNYKTVSLS